MTQLSDRLPLAWADETAHIDKLRLSLQDKLDWGVVRQHCEPWVRGIRHRPPPFWALESLLQEFPLSSSEGLALMRLAEALLRVPDQDTAQALIGDQLSQADFASHQEQNGSAHPWLSGASARVLDLAQQLLASPDARQSATPTLIQRLGGPTVVTATARALQLLGRQFVLGQTMDDALAQAKKQTQPDTDQGLLTRHSFDMLGEGARTWADADRYLASYQHALTQLAQQGSKNARQLPFAQRQGLSIKLSALHPRFDPSQHEALVRELMPRLEQLARQADASGVLLTLDAEESFRLELQLDLLTRLMPHAGDGLGLAVQAYQHRALAVIDEVHRLATTHDKRLTVRLVKGAYWDTEVKRAQELGLSGYPVYTHKAHTDLSYLACADALLARSDVLYPQFATHNAATIAAVMQLAKQHGVDAERYEWQRLHGMGEGVYRELRRSKGANAALRIYAPVGEHRDLLAYLVRRLLENGANASFVHQLADPQVSLDELLASPWVASSAAPDTPLVPPPVQLFGPERRNAIGRDLNCQMHREALEAAIQVRLAQEATPSATRDLSAAEAQAMMDALAEGWQDWEETPAVTRCAVLDKVANRLEAEFDSWAADLVVEARKTMSDAVAEVRETIDLARYYAQQGRHHLQTQSLPGPTGESNEWQLRGRGVFVCIAPWNFPLAIFGGQVMAALATGNAVAAKPADQTPQVARRFIALLHHCGVPANVVDCACGPGQIVGAALVASKHCAGVAFTGSVATGKRIQRMLAQGDRPIVPLIAETGGLNAMVVDSTALPEQVIDAVVASAFLSAGQRCSALRLLCLHSATADALEAMLAGALQTLVTGHSSEWSTDVGPVIDRHAHELLCAHLAELDHQSQQARSGVRHIGCAKLAASTAPDIIAPTAYTLPRVSALTAEHFGPILHVVRWGPGTSAPDIDTLIDQINATGYGLTLGVQTRIDSRAQHIARRSRVGNVYVNRGMTGAVVGSQPFGGQGWSGTGPKAGGPHYLLRFCTEQVVSINTAAAGGNAALLTRGH